MARPLVRFILLRHRAERPQGAGLASVAHARGAAGRAQARSIRDMPKIRGCMLTLSLRATQARRYCSVRGHSYGRTRQCLDARAYAGAEYEHERSTQVSFTSLKLTINKYVTNTRKRGRPKRTASFLTTVLRSHYMLHDSTTADSHELIPRRTAYQVAYISVGV